MLMERARVQELLEGVVCKNNKRRIINWSIGDSLRLSMRYILGLPISQDLIAAFPMVPTVDGEGKQGGVSVCDGGSEGQSWDSVKYNGRERSRPAPFPAVGDHRPRACWAGAAPSLGQQARLPAREAANPATLKTSSLCSSS
jgi:hypothetical protein